MDGVGKYINIVNYYVFLTTVKNMRILHIAAHVGGGIGSAYIGLGVGGDDHHILLLEKPLDTTTLSRVSKTGFRIILDADKERICRELDEADIVVFNWSHHPALTRFLMNFPDIPIRSVLWCHVNGNYYPNIPVDFVKKFDQVMFATPYSLKLPQFRLLGDDYIKEHFHVVYGLNDLTRFGEIRPKEHNGFRIGYVGTLGFCKLHPDFADFCSEVDISDVEFVMAGSTSNKNEIIAKYRRAEAEKRFRFLGHVKDVPIVLSELDVFSYLLNPHHFGATENALLEAMASGLPVIALNQCVEQYIITDGETGILINNPHEYCESIRYLYENPSKAREIGLRAKETVLNQYNIEKNRRRFSETCECAEKYPKKTHRFNDFFGDNPADWFLSCVRSEEKVCFEENRLNELGKIFFEATKGSPNHYFKYFPYDKRLENWVNMLHIV